MDKLKYFISITVILFLTQTATAWNIGAKGRVNGPAVHTTYFLTPNNGAFPVKAKAYVGFFANGSCQFNAMYEMGVDTLQTGNFVDIDAFALKSIIGEGYGCMTIFYTYKQLVMETFQLFFDGVNYTSTFPATSEVMIL